MRIKFKCINSAGESNITTNQDYYILTFLGTPGTGVLVNDLGNVYQNNTSLADPTKWQLVSIEDSGSIQIFP